MGAAAADPGRQRPRVRRSLAAVGVVLVVGVLGLAVLTGLQRRLIYFPGQAVPSLPAWVQPVTTTTSDGLDLRGWVVRPQPSSPLLVVFHGNGGTAADRLPLAEALRDRGIGTLLAEYRGYAGNPGTPGEDGLARDALAWAAWAQASHDGPVAYLGESLGAAVATRLAVERAPAALVLRSPFASLQEAGAVHYPWLPLGLLLRDQYDVIDRIRRVDAPALIILGTADAIVPPAQSRAVHAAAGDRARLLEVPGAGHNDLELLAGDAVVEAIADRLLTRTD